MSEIKLKINEWKPSNYDSLPNVIKLYHGTDIYAMNDIVEDGAISAQRGRQHGETSGINWFSTELTGNFGTGTYFSIEVPKTDFDNNVFRFMNDGEVTSNISEIPIDKYNMRIEKLNGVPLRKFIEVYNECNGDIWEMQDRTIRWDNEGTFQLVTPSYRYIIEHEFGKEATKDYYEFMNESEEKVEQGIMLNASLGDNGMVEGEKINEVDSNEISLKSFEVQDELNPKFWINNKINSRVRLKLLDLADEFYDSLNITWVKPKDIVLTGSIANYNWSKYSDVDVHILVDYKEVWEKTDFVKDYFDSKKQLWSEEHDTLKIYGFPVEMYVEDANAKNPNSGIYSLNKNKWIVEPNDFQDAELNEKYIKNTSAKLMTEIDDIEEKLKNEKDNHKLEVYSTKMKKLFDKLVNQRKESLEKHGELGTYNIIWKVLRRSGYLDKIWDIINSVYNKVNSIKENVNPHTSQIINEMAYGFARQKFRVLRQLPNPIDFSQAEHTAHWNVDRSERSKTYDMRTKGEPVYSFIVDTGHPNGNEIHTITDRAYIIIQNEKTKKLITVLAARPQQIKRYWENQGRELPYSDMYFDLILKFAKYNSGVGLNNK